MRNRFRMIRQAPGLSARLLANRGRRPNAPVKVEAEPLRIEGGPVGILLSHGFTGSPASMKPWAQHLASLGHSVAVPRLPGHGTHWRELNRTGWQDWYAEVNRSFRQLMDSCEQVFAGGLSMGGCLALKLAEEHGRSCAGVMLVNPSVASENRALLVTPVLRHVLPAVGGLGNDIKKSGKQEYAYDRTPLHALHSVTKMWGPVREDLPKVTQPVLLFRSAEDHVVEPLSSRIILQRISSRDVTEHVLEDSYHVATLDNDAPTIFAESGKFIARVAGGNSGQDGDGADVSADSSAGG